MIAMESKAKSFASRPNPWEARRNRARVLAGRYDFAAQMLNFYAKLATVQEQLWQLGREEQPSALSLAEWASYQKVLEPVVEVARSDGPALLSSSATAFGAAPHDLQRAVLHAYLVDIPLPEVSGSSPDAVLFLARAILGPVLESLDLEGAVSSPLSGEERRCPWCWGLPQCKTLREAGEYKSAVQLVCSRCSRAWDYPRRMCGMCGEQALNRLALFEASEVLPHLRIDGCRTCNTYMVTVDMRKEGKAEPLVDELCALPLDLWATEQGFSKAQPNLLGV